MTTAIAEIDMPEAEQAVSEITPVEVAAPALSPRVLELIQPIGSSGTGEKM